MRWILAMTVILPLAVQASMAQPAHIEYPWCAEYGGDMGGASNCGFTTLEQCRATVSGIGGSCEPNPFYQPRAVSAPSKRKRHKTHDAH